MLNTTYDLVRYLSMRMRRDDGQTMAEYGILIAVIAVIVVAAAVILGGAISGVFSSASSKV
jgi:Flp pilus assembly pilin Flp